MAHDNDAIMALGPHLRIAAYGHPDPEFNDIAPGGVIDWDANAVQTITITGTPTGGTFTLTFTDPTTGTQYTTGTIAYNASASTVQTALVALTGIESGDVVCTGGAFPGTAVVCTFGGNLAGTDIALMTANAGGLTGGTAPAVTVTETVEGYSYSEPVYFADDVKVSYVEKSDDFRPIFSLMRTHDTITEKGIDRIKSMIAQRSAAALQYALGAVTRTTQAAGADQTGYSLLTSDETAAPTYYRAMLVLEAPAGGFFLVIIPKCRFEGDLEQAHGTKMEKTAITIKCFADEANDYRTYEVVEQTADAAS